MPPNGFSINPAPSRLRVSQGLLQQLGIQAGDVALSVQLVRFSPGSLDSAAFETWGITLPDQIARSVPQRREEFFYGRLAAGYALSALAESCSVNESTRSIARTTVGIGQQREPLWPTDVVGSISHCAGVAAAVVAPRTRLNGIGLDIEHIAGADACAALRQVALSEIEVGYLRAASIRWPLEFWLTAAFSAKESFYKAAFHDVGSFFGFEAAQLSGVDLRRRCLVFTLTTTLSSRFRRGGTVEVSFNRLDTRTVMTHFAW
jgi:4'-phosphopantetheinyl transferase EntD